MTKTEKCLLAWIEYFEAIDAGEYASRPAPIRDWEYVLLTQSRKALNAKKVNRWQKLMKWLLQKVT